jgi:ADP-ribosylglycohydrolase
VGGTRDLEPELELHGWERREGGRHAPRVELMPQGVYSDDTQLALAVARSLQRPEWWQHLTRVELPWWSQYELGGGGATRRAARAWAKQREP